MQTIPDALFGIIGYPVSHSVSPAMQNAAFKHCKLNYLYLTIAAKPEDLQNVIASMRPLNIRGLNVTIPHKIEVIKYIDTLDPAAKKIGAVNTIVNENGQLKGYNTDFGGFVRLLEHNRIAPAKHRFALLGAGGSAHAISLAICTLGGHLTVLARQEEKAKDLAAKMCLRFKGKAQGLELNEANLEETLAESDIIVNCTPIGMGNLAGQSLIPPRLLRPDLTVIDAIYNPCKTRLLEDAEKKGAKIINGLEMLVWQGAMSFEIWTSQKAPFRVMMKEAEMALDENEK
ncbi:shikimate dehydrogenase [Dehalococcoides mccartyi]|uniref:Shikimate dehydrogenase (NADP(+)) n=1 Tax=Dehalococcoides mccartyi (strain CBDB1) TaxID=255470 RepID=AROE_DEHMC|nr:shikimate dehydrogenase [Dehalococcoides mccartyi]Q3ZZN3.1 RecName: Full=Shikimate dehydrogenase (NADP(+)); Short=SDH [Dehalococcoides mccartyi CBDB1]OBW63075.1 MAG: shikimate dehydrogenase [Dehalococcoides mccartyi]BEL00502.1 shikimate dehydrogenase [Dehalococcoides mccartyi]CAI82630.1 shikimate 5-dehydrogenase [Dehalococcoides mccartyi CBDB1]